MTRQDRRDITAFVVDAFDEDRVTRPYDFFFYIGDLQIRTNGDLYIEGTDHISVGWLNTLRILRARKRYFERQQKKAIEKLISRIAEDQNENPKR